MNDEPQHYYVATIPTREHLDTAYVAVGKKTGPSGWYITTEPGEGVSPSRIFNEALKVIAILKGEHTREDYVYMLVDPEKRLWHVTGTAL
jgi:hypothetical protein